MITNISQKPNFYQLNKIYETLMLQQEKNKFSFKNSLL